MINAMHCATMPSCASRTAMVTMPLAAPASFEPAELVLPENVILSGIIRT
jgi:hypothetical protein